MILVRRLILDRITTEIHEGSGYFVLQDGSLALSGPEDRDVTAIAAGTWLDVSIIPDDTSSFGSALRH